jgi:N-dimethylarginine dimethylaminohydrolase
MDPQAWADSGDALHATAARQWAGLHRTLLARGAAVEAFEPKPELPDLVFTGNAAVVLNRKAVLARFFHPGLHGRQDAAACLSAQRRIGLLPDAAPRPPNESGADICNDNGVMGSGRECSVISKALGIAI